VKPHHRVVFSVILFVIPGLVPGTYELRDDLEIAATPVIGLHRLRSWVPGTRPGMTAQIIESPT
jgi:hypothetical protein